MAQLVIYNEGVKRLKEFELKEKRITYMCDEDTNEHNCDNTNDCIYCLKLVDKAMKLVTNDINIYSYRKEICKRKSHEGFYMNWHCDDCAIFKHNKNFTYQYQNNIPINDKYTLYFTSVPIYTMIIYLNTYGTDFTGGEFNFIDEIIKPIKYQVIFFDSREIHKVNNVKSGVRETILVKFYEK